MWKESVKERKTEKRDVRGVIFSTEMVVLSAGTMSLG